MARCLMVLVACCGLLMMADQAEAGRRGGCRGGSCGVSTGYYGTSYDSYSTGSCVGGSCSVPAAAAPAPAYAAAPAQQAPVVVQSSPSTYRTVSSPSRSYRGRFFGRRSR
jgi:hypothetical protein